MVCLIYWILGRLVPSIDLVELPVWYDVWATTLVAAWVVVVVVALIEEVK